MTNYTKAEIAGYIFLTLALIGFIIGIAWYYENVSNFNSQTGAYILLGASFVAAVISLIMIEFH